MSYDSTARQASITFDGGHVLKVGNIDAEQAEKFFKRHAPEFQKRDCCLHSGGGHVMTRSTRSLGLQRGH